jgi:hypothetical protein
VISLASVWYDGPRVSKYIFTYHPSYYMQLSEAHRRRLLEWAGGSRAGEYVLDEILTKLGSHLDLLPDNLFADPKARKVKTPMAVRAGIVKRLRAGEVTKDLAEEVGVASSTILKWNQRSPGYVPIERVPAATADRVCLGCGDDFVISAYYAKQENRGIFCSRRCYGINRKKLVYAK